MGLPPHAESKNHPTRKERAASTSRAGGWSTRPFIVAWLIYVSLSACHRYTGQMPDKAVAATRCELTKGVECRCLKQEPLWETQIATGDFLELVKR
jgi:hypothetical protein